MHTIALSELSKVLTHDGKVLNDIGFLSIA
ncbi:MAG: hypothetical protein BWY75_01978 [bacterium ADurb.Bin425]|nr:MAG: hypothetical protein BWY75_01978 [bacterium ADurb.Bin425]